MIEGKYGYTGQRIPESYASNKTLKLVKANGCLKSEDFFFFKNVPGIHNKTLMCKTPGNQPAHKKIRTFVKTNNNRSVFNIF